MFHLVALAFCILVSFLGASLPKELQMGEGRAQGRCLWGTKGDPRNQKKDTRGYTMEIPNRGKGTRGMSLRSRGIWRLLCHFPPYTYSYLSCMSSYNVYDANSFPATIWGITVVVHMICMYVTYQEGNADANDDFMEMKSIIWGFTIYQSGPL